MTEAELQQIQLLTEIKNEISTTRQYFVDRDAVALLVSAWIEIILFYWSGYNIQVALLVSAWIEIDLGRYKRRWNLVALLVSAWIEIDSKP